MERKFFKDKKWIQGVLQEIDIGIWSIIIEPDTGKRCLYANDTMLKLLGLLEHPEPEECYRYWEERIGEEYREYVFTCIENLIATNRMQEVQYSWKHPWWGNIFVRCGGRAQTHKDGTIELKGYHQNINELELLKQENRLRNVEIEEIKQQQKLYNELYDSVLCGVSTYRQKNTRVVFKKVNKTMLDIIGYTKEEFWQKEEWDVSELIAKEDIGIYLTETAKLKRVGDKKSSEVRILTKSGEKRWVKENTELVIDINGDEVLQSIYVDINDNKKKSLMLEEVQENIPGGMCLLDLDSCVAIYANEGFYKFLNCSEEQLRELYKNDLSSFIRRTDRKRVSRMVREALLRGEKTVEFEIAIHPLESDKIWLLSKAKIIDDYEGCQLNCIMVDITDRKNKEQELYLNERRLSIALEQTANVVFDYDIKSGKAVLKNGNFGSMVPGGIVDNAIENLVTLGILHKDYQKEFAKMCEEIANGAETSSKEIRVRYKEGAPYVWTKAVLRAIYTENGVPLRAVGILEDISLQKEAEIAFIKEEKYRQAMLAETLVSAEINVTQNTIDKVTGTWGKYRRNMECTYSDLLETELDSEIFSEDKESYLSRVSREAFLEAYTKGQLEVNCEHRRVNENKEIRWIRLTAHLLLEPSSGDLKALIYLKDIDEEKRSELKIKYQSERDSLTGLYNKGTAEMLTKSFLKGETGKGVSHAFIILDLDHFKNVNDSYGHQYGDEVLKSAAAILTDTFRSDDIKGRLGGDEMVILMKNVPSHEMVEEKLSIVKKRLQEVSKNELPITASVGVSFFGEHGWDYQELYHTADVALYKAKRQGRNQFVIYEKKV